MLTFPKAPFPATRWRSKWYRLTSPSKSTGVERQEPMVHPPRGKGEGGETAKEREGIRSVKSVL